MLRCQTHRDRSQGYLLLQVQHEPTLNVAAERELQYDFATRDYIRGAWRRATQPLAPGMYCRHCLRQGDIQPLSYDEIDIEDEGLGEPALLFKNASEFTIAAIWDDLIERFGENIVAYRDLPAQPAVYGTMGEHVRLASPLRETLFGRVLPPGGQLYRHQVEAIDAIYRGEHVTIVTATASGKTLTYAVPVIDAILKNSQATALYLAPLNALAEDQLDAFTTFDQSGRNWNEAVRINPALQYMRDITIGDGKVRLARYDGNVPEGERPDIRAGRPNWVITNPEMLHQAMLSWGSSDHHWRYFFKNLRYVIIDEMHTYKGIFGSNFANLMRRLQRLCYYLGAQPTFICASATIKNPGELARALTSQRHTVIGQDRDGSPRRLRRFVLWDSTKSEEAINTDASTLMAALVGEHRVKTITFGHSIPSVDAIYRYVNGRLQDLFGQRVELIKEFKRALMPDDKRAIARRLREGQLHGVVTTTALKMGIDIGDLSAALIIKYPGSIADVWQQAGRAGRKGEGLIVLMADRDPLNQYFATNPDDFFAMEPEEVFVDPDNKYIILDQLWCAIKDWELNEAIDKRFFGENLPEYLTLLDNEGKVRREAARDAWVLRDKDGTPAREVPIRSMGFSFNVIDDRGNVVAREDAVRAARYLHKFARYPVQDDVFEVIAFDLDLHRRQGSAKVRRVARPVEFLTSSVTRSETTINRTGMQRQSFGASLSFGEITFSSQVYAYYRVPTGGRGDRQARAEFQPLGPAAPPERVFETTASWLTIPARCITEHDEQEFTAGLRSMARALATAVTIQEFCDPADIGGLEVVREPISGQPMIFLHDTVPGGIGIAEQTYYDFENVFRRAYRILNECPNAANNPDHRGCPRCVTEAWGDESVVNRPVALAIMRAMLGDDPVVVRHSDEEIVTILTQNGFANVAYVRPGGMGRIYRAERGGRTLAVKVINPMTRRLSSEAQERMAREASIWKRLVHQNIVPLHEVNQPNGLFYLTMDWMSRGSLRDRLPAAGLTPRESVRIALGVARALTHLANAEFVHRDVKPDNILFDTADQPRLTDFGIAKSVDDDVGVKTRSGLWMGTPGYVPPEQLRDSASCTARTDVFALGVVLYEMLTGVLPGRDTVGGVPPEELNRIGIVALADLLRRMLAEEQSMRPRAAEVVRLLEEITL